MPIHGSYTLMATCEIPLA